MEPYRPAVLLDESIRMDASGLGFRPAFLDVATFSIYPSRHADGRPASTHVLEGLPDEVVVVRRIFATRQVLAAKPTLVAGFERNGFFYTATAVARAVAEWPSPTGEAATDAIAGSTTPKEPR